MDMVSLSRDEVCRYWGLAPSALEALIAAGHILCHVIDGEMRIPLDQIERFFREGLLNAYRIEAADEGVVRIIPSREIDEVAEERPPAAPLQPQPVAASPVAMSTPAEIRAGIAENSENADEDDEDDLYDLRAAPRYIPRRQIDGIIDDVKFTIVQISRTGLRVRHHDEILPAADSKLTFALLNPARSFVMRGRVVWTSAATTASGERKFYVSGVRITEHVDRLVHAIEILKETHDLQPDRRTVARPITDDDMLPVGGVSDDEIAMVMKAIQHFAADPLDANRWYARGRFALAEPQVRRIAPRKPREREEVLGIWEFLDRKVDMSKIGEIMAWVHRNRASASVG